MRRTASSMARGFGLLEVAFAVMIVSIALLGLNAAVMGGIDTATDSVNRRAAREQCRAKLEEILAGTLAPEGAGEVDGYLGFNWTSRTEELTIGVPDQNPTEKVKLVIVELTFPITRGGDEDAGGESTDKITLASVLPEPPQAAQQAQPQ